MKIKHPKFGEIDVSPSEFVEMEKLMEKKDLEVKEPTSEKETAKRKNTKGPSSPYTEEELRFIIEHLDANPVKLAKHPMLQRHPFKSSYSMFWMMKARKTAKISTMAKRLLEEFDAKKPSLLNKDYNSSEFTEA
jgi:hypothetical protein